jgi:hypothetical protein
MLLTIPFLFLLQRADRGALKRVGVLVVAALVVASTAGGVISEMSFRALGLGDRSAGESAAQQRVKIEFPKENLLEIRMDNLRPSRPFEGKWRPWSADFQADTGYQSLLSKKVANLFWYPTWFFPFSLGYLLWRRNLPGLWFGVMGCGALLAPAVVDFGFFEGEILRWLFVFNLASSICFGLALGSLLQRIGRLQGRLVLLLLVGAFCTVGLRISLSDALRALENPGTPLPIGRPGVVPRVGLVPRPFQLLKHHFALSEDDLEAARWLRDNTSSNTLILSDDLNLDVNARAALIGLSGRFPAGYLAPETATSNPQEYPRAPELVRFLLSGEVDELKGLEFDYLLIHRSRRAPSTLSQLEEGEHFRQVHQVGDVVIFRSVP